VGEDRKEAAQQFAGSIAHCRFHLGLSCMVFAQLRKYEYSSNVVCPAFSLCDGCHDRKRGESTLLFKVINSVWLALGLRGGHHEFCLNRMRAGHHRIG
jgi:hypothetical protein